MDIRIIIRIHELITTKQTGTPKELAEKLELSERTIYNYVAFMREELNAPIIYNTALANYCYEVDCELNFNGAIIKWYWFGTIQSYRCFLSNK